MNYALLLANISLFLFFILQGAQTLRWGISNLGVIPTLIVRGQNLWTLFTSMFMHADFMHLFGNMLYLWVFGDNIEDALGHIKYLAFYLIGGLAASFVHIASLYALPSPTFAGFDIPAVGASGAISAVLGAYLMLYPRARIRTLVIYFFITIVSVPAFYYLGFWFIYQLMMGLFSFTGFLSGVAFWAHIGGFLAGVVTVKVFGSKLRLRLSSSEPLRKPPLRPVVIESSTTRKPFADVIVDHAKVRVFVKLPGVGERDVNVKVGEGHVMISATRGDLKYHDQIKLPVSVLPVIEDLHFSNGVLSLSLRRI